MFKRALLLAVALCALPVFSATKDEDLDKDEGQSFGNNQMTWRLFDAGGPVLGFAISPAGVYYANGTEIGLIDGTKPGAKKALVLPAGSSAEGICAVAWDGKAAWFGGPQGIARFTAGKWDVFTKENGLPSDEVRCLRAADNGDVWAATAGGVAVYRGGTLKSFTAADGVAADDVRDIAFGKDGAVWFATSKGVAKYDGVKWSKQDMNSGMSWNDVHAIAVDARNGDVWVACGEQDVNGFQGGQWNTFMDIQRGIHTIMVDTQGRVWMGHEGGIVKYNGEEWLSDPKKTGIPAGVVNATFKDRNGDLYFAGDKGVIHLKNPYPY